MRHNSSKASIRYAVVGLGPIAQVAVLPAFKHASNCQLLALVSGDATKLSKLGRKYSLEHLYSYQDYGRVLSNVDAVYLAVPIISIGNSPSAQPRLVFTSCARSQWRSPRTTAAR